MIRDVPSGLFWVTERLGQALPAAIIPIPVVGVEEGAELGVGDPVTGDAEGVEPVTLAALVDELALRG
jgi:hypothetical protein